MKVKRLKDTAVRGKDEGASRARTVISSQGLDITCPTQRRPKIAALAAYFWVLGDHACVRIDVIYEL
jgi:hypothetical protein